MPRCAPSPAGSFQCRSGFERYKKPPQINRSSSSTINFRLDLSHPNPFRKTHHRFKMFSSLIALAPLLSLVTAAPLAERQQLIPDLPAQVNLAYAESMVRIWSDKLTGVNGRYNYNGDFINSIVPVANTLDQAIGKENVVALDVLADRFCIAGYQQGSLCNELFAYAYSWIVMQEHGKTWRELAQILGVSTHRHLRCQK